MEPFILSQIRNSTATIMTSSRSLSTLKIAIPTSQKVLFLSTAGRTSTLMISGESTMLTTTKFYRTNAVMDLAQRFILQCLPLFAAFCLYESTLSDYLSWPNTSILSVDSDVLDGREVYSIETEYSTPGSPDKTTRYRLYFDRNNFLFLGLTGYWRPNNLDAVYFERRVLYQEAPNSSAVKSVVQWSVSPKDPGVKNVQFEYDVQSIDFVPVAAAEFTLASSGVDEPSNSTARELSAPSTSRSVAPASNASSSTWFLILLVAIAFGMFGVVFAVMASRKRKATE